MVCKTPFTNHQQKGQFLQNTKNKKTITSRVYRIPCGKVYIGETEKMVSIRKKEHQVAVRLKHIAQSVLAEHN